MPFVVLPLRFVSGVRACGRCGACPADTWLRKLLTPNDGREDIRRAGAERMGLDPAVGSVPKIVALHPARAADDVDIRCLALSMGQAHKAVPLTLALCLGAAANFPGTLAARLLRRRGQAGGATVSIGHPSGRIDIGTVMRDGEIVSAELHRTARFMMQGEVLY